MLSFQPAFDPFHSIFRALRIINGLSACLPIDYDRYRILDFYLVFPFRAVDFRFRQGQTRLRLVARGYEALRPYGSLPDDRDLITRMLPVQSLAIQTLATHSLVEHDALMQGQLMKGAEDAPRQILDRVSEANREQNDLMDLLAILSTTNPVLGPDGIKSRSGLLEYRNDPV